MYARINKMVGTPELLVSPYDVEKKFGVTLATCPFCGGPPALYSSRSPHVVCVKCAACGPVFEYNRDSTSLDETKFRAIQAWNGRATETA